MGSLLFFFSNKLIRCFFFWVCFLSFIFDILVSYYEKTILCINNEYKYEYKC